MADKVCTKCKVVQPITAFYKQASSSTGLQSQCKVCHNTRGREKWINGLYNLTPKGYEEILLRQGGVCAICGSPPGARSLAVDHDHETGRVRGLLCTRCNTALGSFKDNATYMTRAIEYLNG